MDPLSLLVSSITLADLSSRAIKELSNLVVECANALKDWESLTNRLYNLDRFIKSVRDLLHSLEAEVIEEKSQLEPYVLLKNALDNLVSDLTSLKTEFPAPLPGEARYRTIWRRAKPIFLHDRLSQATTKLDSNHATIANILSLIGRQNDLRLSAQVRGVQHGVNLAIQTTKDSSTALAREMGEVNTKISHVHAEFDDRIVSLEFAISNAHNVPTAYIQGSATSAAQTPGGLSPLFRHLLSPTTRSAETESFLTNEEAEWFVVQVDRLLRDVWRQASLDISQRQPSHSNAASSPVGSTNEPQDPDRSPQESSHMNRLGTGYYSSVVSDSNVRSFEFQLPLGRLTIVRSGAPTTRRKSRARDGFVKFRMVYVPDECTLQLGIVATLVAIRLNPPIPPMLSTFRTLPRHSPVIDLVRSTNISLRDLLIRGDILPTDRDWAGRSILCYSLLHNDIRGCQALLAVGANPLDCNYIGEALLTYFIKNLPLIMRRTNISSTEIMDIFRLLISHGGTDIHAAASFIQERKSEHRSISITHCALAPDVTIATPILEPLKLMIEDGCDTNEASPAGSTPIHRALRAGPDAEFVGISEALLGAEANPRAIEMPSGDTCLHKLLTRVSACNNHEMSSHDVESVTGLIVLLLQRGCDPGQLNNGNRTPSDYALSPTAWPIWCSALQKAGYDASSVIIQDQIRKSIASMGLYDLETETKIIQVKSQENCEPEGCLYPSTHPGPISPNTPASICFVCRRTGILQPEPRRPPFDYFGTYLLGPQGCEAHEFRFCHEDGSPCLTHFWDHRCTHEEHQEDHERKDMKHEFQWRKEMACKLWEEGDISTPQEAQAWATYNMK